MLSPEYHILPHAHIPSPGRSRPPAAQAAQLDYPGVNAHGAEVLHSRGITPEIAADRGYRSWTASDAEAHGFVREHARAALAIPNFNVASEFDDYQTRPEQAATDPRTGEKRKYLWRIGHTPELAGPPAATPAARERADRVRDDLRVPVVAVESILKLDSVLSNADRDLYGIAPHGNWGWTVNGAPTPALRGIPWRKKRHGKVVHRRDAILMPDSDYWTKQEVAQGWWEFGKDLERRQARVLVAKVPTGPNGEKWGPDDAIAAGATTVAKLIASATPLPHVMPMATPEATADDATLTELERIQRKLAEAEATIANIIALALNPHITPTDKIALLSAGVQVQNMAQSKGEVEPVGSARIAQDFRPAKRPKGTPKPDLNPGGTKPLMERGSVKSAMERATALGWIVATPVIGEVKRSNGTTYPDRQWRIEPAPSLGAFIAPAAAYQPAAPKTRKPYAIRETCVHCGEIHDRTHLTYCGEITANGEIVSGCANVVGRRVERVPLPNREDITDEERAHLDGITRAEITTPGPGESMSGKNPDIVISPSAPASPSPINCQEKIRTCSPPVEPPGFWDAGPDPEPQAEHSAARAALPWDSVPATSDGLSLCLDCGSPTPNTYRCSSCIDEAKRRNDDRWRVSA